MKEIDFLHCLQLIILILQQFCESMENPSQNVINAIHHGCRCTEYTDGYYCEKQIIDVRNATMCFQCFQTHYQQLMYKLNRQWCINHDNGCLSELDEYIPLPGIQTYTLPGLPGGAFKASGHFQLGHYCAACSLWNVAHAEEKAVRANEVPVYDELVKKKKRKRGHGETETLINELQHIPGKTEEQITALKQARDIHLRLKLREKKLKKEEQDLKKILVDLQTVIVPTDVNILN